MRFQWIALASIVVLAGCESPSNTRNYSIYFQPYSAELDQQARESTETAALYARANASLPISVIGFSAPADPGRDVDGLSAQRAEAITQALTAEGVSANRISVSSSSAIDPLPMAMVAVRRVDISIGGAAR